MPLHVINGSWGKSPKEKELLLLGKIGKRYAGEKFPSLEEVELVNHACCKPPGQKWDR